MTQKDQYSTIIEGIAEIKGTVTAMSKDVDGIKKDVRINTKDLTEHKLGVATNREDLALQKEKWKEEKKINNEEMKEVKKRLTKVEFVPNLISHLKTALIWIGSVAGAVYVILKVIDL